MLQEQGDQSESRDSEGSVSRSWVILVLVLRRPGLSNLHPYCTDTAHKSKRRAQPDQAIPTPDWAAGGKEAERLWTQRTPSPPQLGLCSGLRTHLPHREHTVPLVTVFPYLPGHPTPRGVHWAGSGCPTLHMLNPLSSPALGCFRVCASLAAQSCLTLCNPMDDSPPGSIVHGGSPRQEY